jgi:hypothetical protein
MVGSLPPCGGGLGRGVHTGSPDAATPLPTLPHKGGGNRRSAQPSDLIVKQQPQLRDLAALCARVLIPSRKQRAQGKPGARRTHSLACEVKKHTSVVTTGPPDTPAFPAQWFTAYIALSPVTGLSCHRRLAKTSTKLDASVGASGPHDFAVRELAPSSKAQTRVHRIPPQRRDDAQRPSDRGGTRVRCTPDLHFGKTEIFLSKGLDKRPG